MSNHRQVEIEEGNWSPKDQEISPISEGILWLQGYMKK